jgi:hypothetical protein
LDTWYSLNDQRFEAVSFEVVFNSFGHAPDGMCKAVL